MWLGLVVVVAFDAVLTGLGLARGLPEGGLVASWLLPVLGPAYWLFAFVVVYAAVYVLSRVLGARAGVDPGVLMVAGVRASVLVYLVVALVNCYAILAVGG